MTLNNKHYFQHAPAAWRIDIGILRRVSSPRRTTSGPFWYTRYGPSFAHRLNRSTRFGPPSPPAIRAFGGYSRAGISYMVCTVQSPTPCRHHSAGLSARCRARCATPFVLKVAQGNNGPSLSNVVKCSPMWLNTTPSQSS